MKYIFSIISCASLALASLNAQLVIEDFESYRDTNTLQGDVFTFGHAAQAGKPSLAPGLGDKNSNAACFNLTWETGNNANLCFINLSPNTQNLTDYSAITVFMSIEAYPVSAGFTRATIDTIVKFAVEGADGTIWQTRLANAEKPPVGSSRILRFELLSSHMELVEGKSSFAAAISSVKNIRLRFENLKQSGFREDVYIDSLVAVR